MIEVANLTKQYGKLTALNSVSFKVEKGEILGFLGPNGAGKTTAMRIITGYLPPTSGEVSVAGFDVLKQPMEAKRLIGYMPETVPLYEDMTVTESLQFYAEIRGVKKSDREKRINEVLKSCGIEDVKHQLIKTLSKGYRQRVGLAQALINDPEILILDEPTIGLDPKQIIEIRELIRSFIGKRTVILSSHILPEVSVICNRIAIIHRGDLIALDTQDKLASEAAGSPTIAISVKGPSTKVKSGLKKMDGVKLTDVLSKDGKNVNEYVLNLDKDSEEIRKQISKFIIDNDWLLLGMEERGDSLEEIFINLVNKHEGGKR